MSANRREETRSRLLQRAKIVFNGGFSAFDCVVIDISPGGAKLKVPSWASLPQRFELRLPNRPPCKVELRHRGVDSVGVAFLAPAA